ncbi:uncharacterized protein EV422DRAFT_569762 [Fimicolochytrium jonesii]|uniref:uncharacterized protein n=1 Tax=Fimicolochytrium jonesii TaxID=1396493 RepID=UPI0022FE2368|nr:uncharacterized protein EV422DRAFT_569762 [Fimicolochytrium jonesii]KAI8818346.1 hypothetical protein EV422DRAFT_569762 [Fimicolochytrium jonesii]
MTVDGKARFGTGAIVFQQRASELGDPWALRYAGQDVYLTKRVDMLVPGKEGTSQEEGRTDLEMYEPKETAISDPAEASGKYTSTYLSIEFHVLFSTTWQCPTLYFNAWDESGNMLFLSDMQTALQGNVPIALDENHQRTSYDMPAVTQQEHPYLGLPFFYLHPCQTSTIMKEIQDGLRSNDLGLLTSWMSWMNAMIYPLPLLPCVSDDEGRVSLMGPGAGLGE